MPFIVVVSGKIGSGKDYLTGKLIEELESRGKTTAHGSFAAPLKEELGQIINLLKENRDLTEAEASELVSKEFGMTAEQAGWLVEKLYPELGIPELNGWTRTPGVRTCLQLLGTEIRRAQNPNYWTNRFLEHANSLDVDYVFASDGRFPNEMDCAIENGGVTFRLDIPEETLQKRRVNRDGIVYTEEQLNHASETALDDYTRFDYYVGEVVDAPALANILILRDTLKKANLTK